MLGPSGVHPLRPAAPTGPAGRAGARFGAATISLTVIIWTTSRLWLRVSTPVTIVCRQTNAHRHRISGTSTSTAADRAFCVLSVSKR